VARHIALVLPQNDKGEQSWLQVRKKLVRKKLRKKWVLEADDNLVILGSKDPQKASLNPDIEF
jgi:hypothetical protein